MADQFEDKLAQLAAAFPAIGNGRSLGSPKHGRRHASIEGSAFRELPLEEVIARFRDALPENVKLLWNGSFPEEHDSPCLHIATVDSNLGMDIVWGIFASTDWTGDGELIKVCSDLG